ncbi:DNA polymerase I [Nitratiruptor tergarcus]|uniref:DNA polymerase I n=1 Tax=Nitratiruptor tergarcus DSM 16512 TaxID=1069081 RepID=A0A1W1WT25_9BACT|nr:DNA polymerase I [Nitratiruptor tergarcus]SMC09352.1 DNA polymerase I [Nitratiruptor tergarcus DSM 16512]
MKTLTIIDTFGFFFRSFYALPPLKSKQGFPTGLLTGFINFINNLVAEEKSDYIVFALDSEGPSFRAAIDPNYKAQRPTPPEDLQKQLPIAIDWIEKMGFKTLQKEGFEADDIIASLVKCAKQMGIKVKIVSHDKDLYQLIDDEKVVLYDPIKKEEIDEKRAEQKFGVPVKLIGDYLALVGDSADNIPGVKGIGPKTAAKLLNTYGSLDAIYAHIDEVTPPRVRTLLEQGKESAYLSRKLITLRDDVFDSCSLEDYHLPQINPIVKIADELMEYDITAILRKLKATPLIKKSQTQIEFKAICLDNEEELFKVIDTIPQGAIVAFDTETDSLDTKVANLIGFSFSFNEERAYYVPIGHNYLGVGQQVSLDSALRAIKRLFTYNIVGHNLKFDLSLIYRYGIEEITDFADTMILAWLSDPGSSVGLDSVAKRVLDYDMIAYKDTVKKGEDFSNVAIDTACRYASEDAVITYKIYFKLLDTLRSQNAAHLIDEAKEVEFPFVNTLIAMERAGIKLDIAFFEKLRKESEERLKELTQKIYELAGGEFNINSTKQLASVLFEKLGLPPLKKTKSGYSTDETTLQALKDKHPIIAYILEYRELFKLKSTYIDPLLKYAKKDTNHRIYTSFVQTGTATGRLASKNPNLQNIPVKTEVGRQIRYGFIAKEGYKLLGIDYSQIELRLLAHFSQDPALVQAFQEDRDIHLETAIKLFGKDAAQAKRNIAKSINFGLIYGMGSRKLAQTLGISAKEAKEIIESYFNAFPTVKNYLASIEDFAKKYGYVETLLRRRRYFDFAAASGAQLAAYLREATNTVFQGSAADLIKMSMNAIDKIIKNEALPTKMLLQIHDELIFEVKEDMAQDLAQRFASIMEHIYPLRVPIKCSIGIAHRWGDLK